MSMGTCASAWVEATGQPRSIKSRTGQTRSIKSFRSSFSSKSFKKGRWGCCRVMVQQINGLAVRLSNRAGLPGPAWWKERTSSLKLSLWLRVHRHPSQCNCIYKTCMYSYSFRSTFSHCARLTLCPQQQEPFGFSPLSRLGSCIWESHLRVVGYLPTVCRCIALIGVIKSRLVNN